MHTSLVLVGLDSALSPSSIKFDLVSQLLGSKSQNFKWIEKNTGCKVELHGVEKRDNRPLSISIQHSLSNPTSSKNATDFVTRLVKSVREDYRKLGGKVESHEVQVIENETPENPDLISHASNYSSGSNYKSGYDTGGYSYQSSASYGHSETYKQDSHQASYRDNSYDQNHQAYKGSAYTQSSSQYNEPVHDNTQSYKDSYSASSYSADNRHNSNAKYGDVKIERTFTVDEPDKYGSRTVTKISPRSMDNNELLQHLTDLVGDQTSPSSLSDLRYKATALSEQRNQDAIIDHRRAYPTLNAKHGPTFCKLCNEEFDDALVIHIQRKQHRMKYMEYQLQLGFTAFSQLYKDVLLHDMDTKGGSQLAITCLDIYFGKMDIWSVKVNADYQECAILMGHLSDFTCKVCPQSCGSILTWLMHINSDKHIQICCDEMKRLGSSKAFRAEYALVPSPPATAVTKIQSAGTDEKPRAKPTVKRDPSPVSTYAFDAKKEVPSEAPWATKENSEPTYTPTYQSTASKSGYDTSTKVDEYGSSAATGYGSNTATGYDSYAAHTQYGYGQTHPYAQGHYDQSQYSYDQTYGHYYGDNAQYTDKRQYDKGKKKKVPTATLR